MNIVNVGYDSTNYYVLEQGKIRLLVDVGFPRTLPKLRANLRRKGVALGDLSWLLVTHYHPDHAGLVQELRNAGLHHVVWDVQLAGIPVLAKVMKPDSGYVEIRLADCLQLPVAESRAWLAGLGIAGEVVSTPGHSEDSVTLLLDDGSAFTGDLQPPGLVLGDEQAQEVSGRSWAKLAEMGMRVVFPGHGGGGQVDG